MNVFLAYVRDPAYFHLLPRAPRAPRAPSDGRIRVMAFPPLGIQTLAPVLRKAGHRVRMFDTCHPQMRAAVYRGTPLWKEYVATGIVDDDRDWDKTFKCCDIDPDTVPNDEVNRLRMKGYASLLLRRILARPFRTWDLLRTFSRHMAWRDLLRLVSGPFRTKAASAPALPARMVDAGLRAPARGPKVLVPMGRGSTSPP